MCMILISEIEKRQNIGYKVMDRDQYTGILSTPFRDTYMTMDRIYIANGIKTQGIYIFLNKIVAKKFLEILIRIRGKDTLIVKVELGNKIWKGDADKGFIGFGDEGYHFYTTDSVKILSIEE